MTRRLLSRALFLLCIMVSLSPGCATHTYQEGPRVTDLRAWGKYAEAETLSRKTVNDLERTNGPDDVATLAAVGDLAATLTDLGEYAQAETLSRRVLASAERDRRASERSSMTEYRIVVATNGLAGALVEQGKYAEAEALYRRARTATEQQARDFGLLGDPLLAMLTQNLATVLAFKGEYVEAERMYRDVLPGQRRPGQWVPPVQAIWLSSDLSLLLAQQARYREANPLARQAVADSERRLGPHHPETLRSINRLARVLDAWGAHAEAEPMHRRVLAGIEREFGPDHPLAARALFDLGRNALEAGRPEEAEVVLERSLAIRERRLRPGHPDIGESLAEFGAARDARGCPSRADSGRFRRTPAHDAAAGSRSGWQRLRALPHPADQD